jgi:hypothetical protein
MRNADPEMLIPEMLIPDRFFGRAAQDPRAEETVRVA